MTELLLTSSVLITALLVLRRLLQGKLSLRLQYGLWALVAVRLLVPVSFGASPVSVLNAVPETGGMEALYLSPVRDSLVPADGRQEPVTQYDFRPAQLAPASPDNVVSYVDRYDVSHRVEYARQIDLPALLRPVWLLGAALMAVWFFAVNLSFRRKLKNAVPVEVPDCPLPVFSLESLPSPCLAGLFRPAVYVTPVCLEDEARLRHVLTHELTHWRHKDPFWSLVRCVCLSIYWFHPLVWLAAFLSRRDCELACDEGALARLGEDQRTAYGRTLIGLMAVSSSPAHLLQTATTMVDRKKGVKERLTLIAKKPKMLAVTAVAVVLAAAALAVCTFTGSETPEAEPGPDAEPTPISSAGPAHYARLSEALADVPEELAQQLVIFTPEQPPEAFELFGCELLSAYCSAYYALSSNLSDPGGWVASLCRFSPEEREAWGSRCGNGLGIPEGTYDFFATDGTWSYAICTPYIVPSMYGLEDEGQSAFDGAVAWLREAVLARDGMAPIPKMNLTVTITPGTTNASLDPSVVERLLSADEVILTRVGGESFSTPPDGWDCLLGDNTLRSFLMDYYEMTEVSVVGLASPEDNWTYSISTADGSVCLIAHEISGLVTWIVDGQTTYCMAHPVTDEIDPIGEKLADWYEQLELQWISGNITSLSDGELFQFLLDLDASYYLSNAQRELGDRFLARPGDILALVEAARGSRPALWNGDGAEWFTGLLIAEFAANRPGEVQSALDALAGFADGDYSGAVGTLRAALGRTSTEADAQAAYAALLAGDFTVLVPWQQGEYWTASSIYWTGLEYMTLDLDGDGVSELITQFKDSPASQNAVFHYAGGQVDCWRWDGMDGGEFSYPLRDGTMVYEFRSGGSSLRSYTLFYYNAQGQPLNIVMLSASSGDSAVFTIDGEDVSRAQFEAKFDELITSRLPGPEAWTLLVPGWED